MPHNPIQAGFGKVEITPPADAYGSYRLSGIKRHSGIHDPLYAQALVIRHLQQTCLLISLDVGMVAEPQLNATKTQLASATGISAQAILIAATHTHNGPETLNEEDDPHIKIWPSIQAAIITAAQQALSTLTDAQLSWAKTNLPTAINRYQHRLGQDANTIDPQLDVLLVSRPTGEHLGLLYHYAAHPTCAMAAEFQISGDYCGLACRRLEQQLGGFAMFFNGACGNINLEVGQRSFASAEKHATQVAEAVLQAIASPPTPVAPSLTWATDTVTVGIKPAPTEPLIDLTPLKAELDHARTHDWQTVIADTASQRALFRVYQTYRTTLWKKLLGEHVVDNSHETLPLQIIRFGPLILVAIPGEPFIEHQLQLQARFPDYRVMIIGYANGYAGYIPTTDAMANPTYETQATLVHRVDAQAGNQLIQAATTLIAKATHLANPAQGE